MSFEPVFCRVYGRPRDVRSGHAVMGISARNGSIHAKGSVRLELKQMFRSRLAVDNVRS